MRRLPLRKMQRTSRARPHASAAGSAEAQRMGCEPWDLCEAQREPT
jgi:hypothetical protein